MTEPVAATRAGKLRGFEGDHGLAFLGVPYAAPPIGPLRFAPPQPVRPWTGERDALTFGHVAPQRVLPSIEGMAFAAPSLQADPDEDCLYLNVWTPALDDARRPVMVWIPGGGYLLGAGSLEGQVPSALTRQDVVVVSFNYRLGLLGYVHFDTIDGLGASANVGLRDQIAALQWVQDNIAAFGGDPGNVTIFGVSAGGMSVGTLLGTPSAAGLFHRAIAQSGAAHYVHDRATADRVVDGLLDVFGLDRSTAGRIRDIPFAELIEGQEQFYDLFRDVTWPGAWVDPNRSTAAWAMAYQPVVDGVVLPEPPLDAVANGRGHPVPLILGNTRHDQGGSMYVDARCPADVDGLAAAMAARLPDRLAQDEKVVADLVGAYPFPVPGRASAGEAYVDLETDRLFRGPAHRLAAAQSRHHPAYLYRFTWESPLPMIRSGHGLDIPFVLDGRDAPGMDMYAGTGPEVEALAAAILDAWITFARTGKPPANWTPFDPDHPMAMELGSHIGMVDARDAQIAAWDGLL